MKKICWSIFAASIILVACKTSTSHKSLEPTAFQQQMKDDSPIILDVRTAQEFSNGHLQGAQNIDWNSGDFEQKVAQLPKDKKILVYCMSGGRSEEAAAKLTSLGFTNVQALKGGLVAWNAASLPIKSANPAPSSTAAAQPSAGMNMEQMEAYIATHKNVVVDFYADWCGPCKQMAPVLADIEAKNGEKFKVLKINFDHSKQLAAQLGIRGIPHLNIYKDGKQVDQIVGFSPSHAQQFTAQILKHFN